MQETRRTKKKKGDMDMDNKDTDVVIAIVSRPARWGRAYAFARYVRADNGGWRYERDVSRTLYSNATRRDNAEADRIRAIYTARHIPIVDGRPTRTPPTKEVAQ